MNPISSSCDVSVPGGDTYGYGCLASQAQFERGRIKGIALDSKNNLYIVDQSASLIRVVYAGGSNNPVAGLITAANSSVTPQQGFIYAIAGVVDSGGYTSTTGGSSAASTQIGSPISVAGDPSGNVLFTTSDSNTGAPALLALSVSGSLPGISNPTQGNVYTIVGENGNNTSGPLSAFSFNTPVGMAIDAAGNIYVADSGSPAFWLLYVGGSAGSTILGQSNLSPGNVYLVAGGPTASGFSTSFTPLSATTVSILPSDVKLDSAGDVYLVDSNLGTIVRIDPSGNLTQVVGITNTSYTCAAPVDPDDDGCAADTGVSLPSAYIAVDSQGNVSIVVGNEDDTCQRNCFRERCQERFRTGNARLSYLLIMARS